MKHLLIAILLLTLFGTLSAQYKGGVGRGTASASAVKVVLSVNDKSAVPSEFSLCQNFPNPFNPSTTIIFHLSTSVFTSLKVFDVLGRTVATLAAEPLPPGTYARQWNAEGVPSGVYFYRFTAGSFSETKRLLLIR